MVEFKRKKAESFEAFLRRFNKRLQQSGKLYSVRQNRYHKKDKNHEQIKESALIGIKLRRTKEYQRKIGKLKEENNGRW